MRKSNNRQKAIENGEKTYHGSPCKNCGQTEKYVIGYNCKRCHTERGLKKLNDPELMAKYRTKDKQNAKLKRWRKENPDKVREQYERSKAKGIQTAKSARYRAKKRSQTPPDADYQEINSIYEECQRISKETGIPHEVDHIIPISKGGLHHQDNLRIITQSENRTKGNKL